MRKNALIAVLAVIGMITTAQVKGSELNLKMFDRSLITVSIDNGPFTAPAPKVNFKQVPDGYRLITVYGIMPGSFNCPAAQRLLFNEMVYVPHAVGMNAVINRFGDFKVNAIVPLFQPACNTNYYSNYNGYNSGYSNNPVYGNANNYPHTNAFCSSDFDALLNTVSQQSFDQTRLSIAKQAIDGRRLNTSQVAELMRLFSFESTKLDFAKYAYQFTGDRDRYYVINNEFSFSSSVDELVNFINKV